MLAASKSIKYDINDDNIYLGKLVISKFVKDISNYKIPFIKIKKQTLTKIGNGDYADFDSFIISSLNDYYTKLSTPSDLETKEKMLENYTKLYSLWSSICSKKSENDVVELNSLYNKISYGLYLMGYSDKQL